MKTSNSLFAMKQAIHESTRGPARISKMCHIKYDIVTHFLLNPSVAMVFFKTYIAIEEGGK